MSLLQHCYISASVVIIVNFTYVNNTASVAGVTLHDTQNSNYLRMSLLQHC